MSHHGYSRRAFLRGAGAALALPFLESLLPRELWAAPPPPPKRFLAFYVPNGMHMSAWTPAQVGDVWSLSPILSPLAPVKAKTLVLSGLANRPARPDGPGDHASGTGAFLTVAHPFKTSGANIKNGISMDQVAAGVIGQASPFPSLQLGTDGGSGAGDCDSGYSCAYSRNISWAGDATPLPKLTNPQTVFDRLFGGFDPTQTRAEIEKRKRYRKSVLDYTLARTTDLRARMGRSDQRKLDEHLAGIREVETRIADMTAQVCEAGARPVAPADYPAHVKVMCDLMVLGLKCDVSRIITFMLGNAGSGRSFPFLGVPNAHHEISHHQGDPAKHAQLQTIDTWEVTQLAYLAQQMDAVDEGGGVTLLDRSAIFFSSEIEDGNSHSHFNMPVLVLGGLGGALRPGRHVRYANQESVANLFVSLLNGLDVPTQSFGDSTGALPNLT